MVARKLKPLVVASLAALIAALSLGASPVLAVAQRTFVASTGSDSNACTLAAPCRSFTAALVQTSVGGEIIVLDSAGYGPVIIGKAVSIIAPPGIFAAISVFPGNHGVRVNAPGSGVTLRGLTITGQGGSAGIWIDSAAQLRIERCTISRMGGEGIGVPLASGVDTLIVVDTEVFDNAGHGIAVYGALRAVFDRVRSSGNSAAGLFIDAGVHAIVSNSVFAHNDSGILAVSSTAPPMSVSIDASHIADNDSAGVAANGFIVATISLSIARSTVRGNGNGIAASGPGGTNVVVSAYENVVTANASDGISASSIGARVIAARNTVTRNGYGLSNYASAVFYSTGDNLVDANVNGGFFGPISAAAVK